MEIGGDAPLIGNPEHYDGNLGAQAKPSTTGAEYEYRGCFSSGKLGDQRAFTLAEILITLSIIGVVAALTIPSLVVKNQEKERIVQLKKVYNVFSNAVNMATIDYGSPDNWGWEFNRELPSAEQNGESSSKVLNMLSKYLNLQRNCGAEKGCFPQSSTSLNGSQVLYYDEMARAAKGILNDGTNIFIISWSNNCDTSWGNSQALKRGCATISADINGAKGPNIKGIDHFDFYITKYGLLPVGLPDETNNTLAKTCKNKNSSGTSNGNACTAWVLMKENMDYLRRDISWNE